MGEKINPSSPSPSQPVGHEAHQPASKKSVLWKGRFKVRVSDGVRNRLRQLKPNFTSRTSGKRLFKRITKEEVKFRFGLLKPSNWASRAVPRMNGQIKGQVASALSSLREGKTEDFVNSLFSVRDLMHQRAFYTGEGHAQEDFLNNIETEILNHPEVYTGQLLAGFSDENSYLNCLRSAIDDAYESFSDQDVLASNHILTLSSARSFLIKLGQLALGNEKAAEWLRQESGHDNDVLNKVSEAVRRLPPGRLQ